MSLLHNALHLHFVAARDDETRRARQQQQENVAATAGAALQAKHEDILYHLCFHVFGCTCSGTLFGYVP